MTQISTIPTEAEIQAYIDGELDLPRRIEVEAHLEANPTLAAQVMADLRLRDALRLAFAEDAGIRVASYENARLLGRAVRWRRLTVRLRRVAAVVLLVGIGWGAQSLLGVTRIDSASAGIPAYADEAGDAYRTVLYRHLVDPAEPKGGLKPEDLAKAPITLPDLPQGWSIRSIEVVPWDGGSGFEATIDTDRFGLVTLFAASTDGFDVQQPQAQRANDVTVAYWQVGPAVYALCAEARADDLLTAANGLADTLY
jgi:anti-sigma factor RsiW